MSKMIKNKKTLTILVIALFLMIVFLLIWYLYYNNNKKEVNYCAYKNDGRFDVVEPLKDVPNNIELDLVAQAKANKRIFDLQFDWAFSDKVVFDLYQSLPKEYFLRDLEKIPGTDQYLGVYISGYAFTEWSTPDDLPYITCEEALRGEVTISGDYYLFVFDGKNIISSVKIPDYGDFETLSISLLNTKNNNNYYFGGEEKDGNYEIERAKLINFQDYTGDGVAHEFILPGYYMACGHVGYAVAGYDQVNNQPTVYKINISKTGEDYVYWRDRFKPNNLGEVKVIWNCGDHGAITMDTDIYLFNEIKQSYDLHYSSVEKCNFD